MPRMKHCNHHTSDLQFLHRFFPIFEKKRLRQAFVASGFLLFICLLAASCKKQAAGFTAEERHVADSIVRATHGIEALTRLQKQQERAGNKLGNIIALRELGKELRNESRFEEAIGFHSEGLRLAEAAGDTLERVQALNNIGTDYRRMGVLDMAQEYHTKACMLSEECSDTSFTARKNRVVSLNGLGNIYMTLGNHERATELLRRALKGEQALNSDIGQAINYANLGSIFEQQGKTDSAWVYYHLSMAHNQRAHNTLGMALCHNYFGSLYEKAHQYDKAISEYETSYQLMKDSKDEWHALNALIALAGISNAMHDEAKTLDYLSRAKPIAERILSKEHLADIYTLYYKHYKRTGDHRSALYAHEQATNLKDSVLDMEKMNRIQNISLNIERNRQKRVVEEARLKLEQERMARHIGYVIFGSVLLVLVGVLATFFYIQRIHRRNHLALKQLSELRESFFTNITHEFRTPLTIILGLSHEMQKTESKAVRQKAETIEQQGKGLLSLINQLLDISKVKSAVGNSDWYNGNITAHLTMIIETYRDYAHSRNINLQFLAKETVVMDFIPHYINKLMNNLLSNAFKFTPEYGKIDVSVWREKDHLFIDITDTGEGMDKETTAHVFEAFYQGKNEMQHIGTGVGLALVKQIVDAVAGSITVESKIGKGSTFHVCIPIHNTVKRKATATPEIIKPLLPKLKAPLAESEHKENACQLLIIEDNADIAAYIGGQFADQYAVSYASNGREGLQKAQELVPDLIITDLMMPEIDGLEVCRQVRTNEIISHIPIIIVTAKITEEERIKGIEAGADAYLSKPFNSQELQTRVEALLTGRKLLQEKFATTMELNENEEQDSELTTDADMRFLIKVTTAVYLQLNKNKEIDVAFLASSMCMSPRQFHRKIHALTGYAPAAYIQRLKIKKARNMLDKDMIISFTEVAYQCGFDAYPNFVRAFKNVCGVTPSDYRRDQATPVSDTASN